jgi:hypothetical protein
LPSRARDALELPSFEDVSPTRCYISALPGPRERLMFPDVELGGGGVPTNGAPPAPPAPPERTFQQADVDRIVQERVRSLNDKLKTYEASQQRLAEIEQKLAEADEREQKAREEAELKGKTEVEKLQHQVHKATEAARVRDAEWQKKLADADTLKQQAEQRFVDFVKRSAVSDALIAAGLIKGASKDATQSFLSEAQIELSDDHQVRSITVGGKSFERVADAAKHFLTEKPYFAEALLGGAGSPRSSVTGAQDGQSAQSLSGLLSHGLRKAGRAV